MSLAATERKKRLAITGISIISPLGIGPEAVWEAACQQKVELRKEKIHVADGKTRTFYFHKVTAGDSIALDRETVSAVDSWKEGRIDDDLFWAIAAARMAIRDSRLRYDPEDNAVSLFVTHENPGLEIFFDRTIRESYALLAKRRRRHRQMEQAAFVEEIYRRCSADGYDAQTFVYLYLIQKALSVHGHASYTCNACASGLYALEAAAREIRCGSSSAALIVASDHPRYLYKFLWFEQQGLFSPDGLIKPFDRRRNGFALGDGAAALVLEEWDCAKARGARIYAEYLGGGFGAQGWKVIVPDLTSHVYARTMRLALEQAGLTPSDIDLINPHGVGTSAGDVYEAKAIADVFDRPERQPPVMALKPYIGHNLGGSALMETILVLLCMRHGTVLPTLNYCEPDPSLNVRVEARTITKRLRYVMKTASGFAGFDASIVLGQA